MTDLLELRIDFENLRADVRKLENLNMYLKELVDTLKRRINALEQEERCSCGNNRK